jgi:hypothetical protein
MGRYAIMTVLALTFGLIAYGHGLRSTFWASEMDVVRIFSDTQARNIAQSAAFIASMRVANEDAAFDPAANTTIFLPNADSSFSTWTAMNGGYRYEVQNIGDSLLVVRSFGQFGNSEYRVDVTIAFAEDSWNPNLDRAVFSGTTIDLTGSSGVVGGHVATNSTAPGAVTMGWSTFIDSSLAVGPGANPAIVVNNSRPLNANIGSGVRNLANHENYELPAFPTFPAMANVALPINVSGGSNQTITHTYFENSYVPLIRVRSNRTLTINVGNEDRVLRVGTLNIEQGHLNITGTGKLTIYIEDSFNLGGSSTMNQHRDSNTAFVYYAGTSALSFTGSTMYKGGIYAQTANIGIGGSGGIQGNIITGGAEVNIFGNAEALSRIVYAPNAHVSLTGSGRIRGAVVSNSFSAVGNTRVIYSATFDDDLPTDLKGSSNSKRIVRSWR